MPPLLSGQNVDAQILEYNVLQNCPPPPQERPYLSYDHVQDFIAESVAF